MGLCRCSVDNYSLNPGDLVSSNCSVTHVRWGRHFLSAVSMTARIFSALATWKQCCITLIRGILGKAIFSRQFSARYHNKKRKKKKKKRYWAYVAVVLIITLSILATFRVSSNCSVTHVRWGALPQCCFNDGPHFQRSGDVETVLFQCITLITFGILDQTSPNF